MITIQLKNQKGLVSFLNSKNYIYEVVQDGWSVSLDFHHAKDIFSVGVEFGQWLANNPQLVTIQELEQRGDIPGIS